MNALEVYSNFGTPKNLQRHMLRVAALASMILEEWTGSSIDKASIIVTCLFHDMAKPINFDMSKQASFVSSDEELRKLQQHHDDLISRFGTDEHGALIKIFKEIGLSENSQRLINNLEWHYSDKLIDENDIESLVPIYADMRISPTSVLSLQERILELHSRSPIENVEQRLESAQRLEDVIAKNTSLTLGKITNAQIESRVDQISRMEIS